MHRRARNLFDDEAKDQNEEKRKGERHGQPPRQTRQTDSRHALSRWRHAAGQSDRHRVAPTAASPCACWWTARPAANPISKIAWSVADRSCCAAWWLVLVFCSVFVCCV